MFTLSYVNTALNQSAFRIHKCICIGYHMRGEVIISFIARETRAIKLILPSLECDNLFITYLCLYLEQKPDYIIYTWSTFQNEFKIIV